MIWATGYFCDLQGTLTVARNALPVIAPLVASKPKRHNSKLCPLAIRERIVNAVAAGDCKSAIARALRVLRNTVSPIAEQEWNKVEQRKARIAAQAERAATRAIDRINQKLDSTR